jgi:hypothetical protein
VVIGIVVLFSQQDEARAGEAPAQGLGVDEARGGHVPHAAGEDMLTAERCLPCGSVQLHCGRAGGEDENSGEP